MATAGFGSARREVDIVRTTGLYGETHVRPAVLFDVNDPDAVPPPGSIDAQFRCPVSLSVMLDGMVRGGLHHQVQAWGDTYVGFATRMLREVQEVAGYATRDAETAVPARLSLAAIVEASVPGMDEARWHCHVYIGPTAEDLADGTRRPVATEIVSREVQQAAYRTYLRELQPLSARLLEVEWGQPRPGAEPEIVDPPWHEHIGAGDRGVCAGPWGQIGPLVLADESVLRLAARSERQIAAEREMGNDLSADWEAARAAREAWAARMTSGAVRRA